MLKRLKTSLGVGAGLAALSLGGAAIAGAATGTAHPPGKHVKHVQPVKRQAVQTRDTDQVQSGDQSTPDSGGTTSAETSSESAAETGSEAAGETAAGNDGPGGHADEPGNPNANTQQQGEN